MKFKLYFFVSIFLTFSLFAMHYDKQPVSLQHVESPVVTNFKDIKINLTFFEKFNVLPDEIKLKIWHSYNQDQIIEHGQKDHKFIVAVDQNFTAQQLEPRTIRYRNAFYWNGDNFSEDKVTCDTKKKCYKENNKKHKDIYSLNTLACINNNNCYVERVNTKNILCDYKHRVGTIGKNTISFTMLDKPSFRYLESIHPTQNQYLFSLQNNSLVLVWLNFFNQIKFTEVLKSYEPHTQTARFGPKNTIFISETENDTGITTIIQHDYEQNKVTKVINLQELLNGCLRKNKSLSFSTLYQIMLEKMHKNHIKVDDLSHKNNDLSTYLDQYCPESNFNDKSEFFIELLDFVHPLSESPYLLLKFNIGLPFCSCGKSHLETYFVDKSFHHFALYNIDTNQMFYIGEKQCITTELRYLPYHKSLKYNKMYYYLYDFINYQANNNETVFCYDDNLNKDNKDQYIRSRKLVAIVPDDDIARLENILLTTVATHWCSKNKKLLTKNVKQISKGKKILNYLQQSHNTLLQTNNIHLQRQINLLTTLIKSIDNKLAHLKS